MNDQQLIHQLKSLKSIHPDRNWVALTRSQFAEMSPKTSILDIFTFAVPRMAAVPVMAAVVALVGGITIARDANYEEGAFVASVRHKSLSLETKEEITAYTVVFDKDQDKQESFKDALRNRIEVKIGKIKDLFAQLEDEDLAREISLNPRRYEENFKLADEELGKQVKTLLAGAEAALAEGNLIDALDLVNAIEKLLD
jgi:hypothetical protein